MTDPVPSLVVGPPASQPLVLAGPPAALKGRIPYHNQGGANVVLREAGLSDPSGVLQFRPSRHAITPRVLRPDQSGTLPLSVAVHPGTPPGEYRVELDIGGQTRPAILHVAEVVELSVTPDSLVVANEVGTPQTKRVIVTNEGNVPIRLDDPGLVDLYEDAPPTRVSRLGVLPLPDREERDLDALVVAVLAAVRQEGPAGRVRVRASRADASVNPGETKALDLEITLQDDLPPGRRYRARVPVLTRDVSVIVVASGGSLEQDEPPRAARTTKATAKSPKKRGGTP